MFGAIAQGTTHVKGLLEGDDILATADVMRGLGATITKEEDQGETVWIVKGVGKAGFRASNTPLDCGNAGTGVRLIMGLTAAHPIDATFIGDESLTKRPMARVLDPLAEMGVDYDCAEGKRLPVTIRGKKGALKAIDYTPPHASAQVKSCILLAGLGAEGETIIREKVLTRDHTENMLEAFGVTVERQTVGRGQVVKMKGPATLTATDVVVPGDPSSASFAIVAGLIVPGSDLVIENVMMNPTRTGLFETLVELSLIHI